MKVFDGQLAAGEFGGLDVVRNSEILVVATRTSPVIDELGTGRLRCEQTTSSGQSSSKTSSHIIHLEHDTQLPSCCHVVVKLFALKSSSYIMLTAFNRTNLVGRIYVGV